MLDTQYTLNTKTGDISPIIDADAVRAKDAEDIVPTYARLPITLVRGSGMHVWDSDGKQYLDFLAGIAVNGVGHCHPSVVSAVQEQVGLLMHTSNLYYTAPGADLAAALARISGFQRAFFCNSGAEANEAALKTARKFGNSQTTPGKTQIVTAKQSFHGRTFGTLTATGQPKYQEAFRPLVPDFSTVPYNDIAALEAAVTDQTCAVMLEPIQGESGVYPARKDYLEAARSLCDRHNALLIFDEVQTGMGRTGHWWAYQHYGVVPDILTAAKALGGGFPIGAMLVRGPAADVLQPGDHGTTFGGNPLAARAALAVIHAMESEHLVANAQAMGTYFMRRLQTAAFSPAVEDVRGVGLMIGVSLRKPQARQVQSRALEQGLILNAIGDKTLRFLPPLIVRQEHIDQAITILEGVIE